jgi:hypothetical protein
LQKQAPIRAYLAWRLAAYRRQYPDLPEPAEVVLVARLTRVPEPPGPAPWDWEVMGQFYVARWRLADRSLDPFDPVAGDFKPLAGP